VDYHVERVELKEQPTAVVRGVVPAAGIAEFLGGVFGEVMRVISSQGLRPDGTPVGCYVPTPDGLQVEAGFPTSAGRPRASTVGGHRAQREQGETMTTLKNRPNTALVVIDVQNGVVEGAYEGDAVVANIDSLVDKARRERVPVVWVQHSDEQLVRGSDDWQIVPELTPGDGEPLVEKSCGDSFEDTTLEAVVSGLGVGRLVVAGAQTDACIRSTLHGAVVRGYDATLVSDAHTTEDRTAWGAPPPDQVIAHTNLYWTYHTAPGRTAGTVETEDVDFGVSS